MATRDDVTVRIDVELRAKAKELDINLSRLLEDKLADEIARRETIAKTLQDSEEIRLDLEDEIGRPYVGRITGKLLGEARDVSVYLLADERVIVYDGDRLAYREVDDLDDLEGWFPHDPGVYTEIMHGLGETPEIEI